MTLSGKDLMEMKYLYSVLASSGLSKPDDADTRMESRRLLVLSSLIFHQKEGVGYPRYLECRDSLWIGEFQVCASWHAASSTG